MRLFTVAITAEERRERGFARLLNEALHAIQNAYMQACVSQKNATITITVTAEEPEPPCE